MHLTQDAIAEVVSRALAEDLGCGDITTDALVSPRLQGRAFFLVKAAGVVAGIPVIREVFRQVDSQLELEGLVEDGTRVKAVEHIGGVKGSVASVLKAERTALNFLQRLSGIASTAARCATSYSCAARRWA